MKNSLNILKTYDLDDAHYPWDQVRSALCRDNREKSIFASFFKPSLRKRKKRIERDIRASKRLLVGVAIDVCDVNNGIFSVTCKDVSGIVKQSTITPDGFYDGKNKVAIDANKESELHSWASLRDIVLLHIPEMRELWKATDPSNLRSTLFSGSGSSRPSAQPQALAQPQQG